jgi:diguanylate cyclase (GGDEF)-like protein
VAGNTTNPAMHARQMPVVHAVLAIAGCVAGALIFNYLLFRAAGLPFLWTGVIGAAAVAVAIATPLLAFGARRERELAGLRLKLNRVSSADHLTDCLDGAVFTALVDAFRAGAEDRPGNRRGALLVVDVDHFKDVNARFGRSWGDEALRVVSNVIRASLRSGDLVGRLGGEEFGVFLPGARRENAEDIAERVRKVIADTLFEPGGKRCLLTVSVGGVVFEDQLIFDELIEAAEEELLSAKNAGRNRTAVRAMPRLPVEMVVAG